MIRYCYNAKCDYFDMMVSSLMMPPYSMSPALSLMMPWTPSTDGTSTCKGASTSEWSNSEQEDGDDSVGAATSDDGTVSNWDLTAHPQPVLPILVGRRNAKLLGR